MRGAYERIVLGHDDGREDSAGLLKDKQPCLTAIIIRSFPAEV